MFKCSIAELSLALLTATPFLAQMGTEAKTIAPPATKPIALQPHNQRQQPK